MSSGNAGPEIAVKRLPHGQGLPLPAYETDHAAGMDLRAALPEDAPLTLHPGDRRPVPTGLAVAIPPGFEGQVRPRSGLALRHGVSCLNSPGTVDADYRGEVCAVLINHGAEPFTIHRGDRNAQHIVAPVSRVEIEVVAELDGTARGEGGFGHTGR